MSYFANEARVAIDGSKFRPRPNELSLQFMSIAGMNPFHECDSSGRIQMFCNHLGQHLVIAEPTPRRIQTGLEREVGKYTFNVKMPCRGRILKIIKRYPESSLGSQAIRENPETVVIYQDINDYTVGHFTLKAHCSQHQYFGFKYVTKDGIHQLVERAIIDEGVVFLDSPAIDATNNYAYGREVKVALVSSAYCSEDGIGICRDVLPKFGFIKLERRVVEFGRRFFPLNIHGDSANYKPILDIGDYVPKHGLLAALRAYDSGGLAPVQQDIYGTQEIDYTFDRLVHADAGGRVVDIIVHHDFKATNPALSHIESQGLKYDNARRRFYRTIHDFYLKLSRENPTIVLKPDFHRLVEFAISVVSEETNRSSVTKLYRQTPMDDWRFEFVIEYPVIPNIGFKFTDCHGGKGVVCKILEPEEMMRFPDGTRADLHMDPLSSAGRMNPGRLFEQYINASGDATHRRLCELFGIAPHTRYHAALRHIQQLPADLFNYAWEKLMGFYKCASFEMTQWFKNGKVKETPLEYMAFIIQNGIYLYMPPNSLLEKWMIVQALQSDPFYEPVMDYASFRGVTGEWKTLRDKILIGSMYFMLLEKTGDDWSATASPKFQHFGIPAQLTKADKYSSAAREQPVRAFGEAEVRIFISYIGTRWVAEFIDRNNNPKTHKLMVYNLLVADKPTDIRCLVDRNTVAFGGAKPILLVKHLAACRGYAYRWAPYSPSWGDTSYESR